MFVKAKLKLWLLLIVGSILISKAPGIIKSLHKQYEANKIAENTITTYTVDIESNDISLKNAITGKKFNIDNSNYQLMVSNNNPDIVITTDEKTRTGYKEFKNYLYVPYIMVMNPYLGEASQTYIYKDNSGDYSKDIRYILLDIENEKTWKDVDLDHDGTVGKTSKLVKLIIPNEFSDEYMKIREYFIYALNDYKKPNEEEYNELANRVDNILGKCERVEDLTTLFHQSSWFKGIVLCKESIISKNKNSFSRSGCKVICPTKTISDNYNVYIKEDKAENALKILKSINFLHESGFRNIEYNDISKSGAYSKSFEIFSIIDLDESNFANLNYKSTNMESLKENEKNDYASVFDIELESESKTSAEAEETTMESEAIEETEKEETLEDQTQDEVEVEENTQETVQAENEKDDGVGLEIILYLAIIIFFIAMAVSIMLA